MFQEFYLRVDVSDGTNTGGSLVFVSCGNCGGGGQMRVSVYPNPSTTIFEVVVEEEPSVAEQRPATAEPQVAEPFVFTLYTQTGHPVRRIVTSSARHGFSTDGLLGGSYFLRVDRKGRTVIKQVRIEK